MTKGTDAVHPWALDSIHGQLGLTKREYFAAMAMQGFTTTSAGGWHSKASQMECALMSVEMADALIAELNKDSKQV